MKNNRSIQKVEEYMSENFSENIESFSELSKSDSGEKLVDNSKKAFNFDKLVERFYKEDSLPSTTDALYFNTCVNFIEFKPVNTDTKDLLEAYDLIQKSTTKQNVLKRAEELLESKHEGNIKRKACDSIKVFKEKILSQVDVNSEEVKTKFIWVINEKKDASRAYSSALAKRIGSCDDIQSSLLNKLKNFKSTDKMGQPVYYNWVEVWNTIEFSIKLEKNT